MMIIENDAAMQKLGRRIGVKLRGGECLELVGDVGAGKTTFTKGIALGLDIDEDVQSPTFTLSREYAARDGLTLAHYDFYRLQEAGVLSFELAESLLDPNTITIVEWGETIGAVLPDKRVTVMIEYMPDNEARKVTLSGENADTYLEDIQ